MTPKYSIVVPTTGNLNSLNTLLKSVMNLGDISNTEVILVLNPPSDKIQILSKSFENMNLKILTSSAGVNSARNVGLTNATGKLIFFLDDDCWIGDHFFLEKHAALHDKNPWAFAVGGYYVNTNPSALAEAYGEIQRQWLLQNLFSTSGECLTLLGGHFSIKNTKRPPLFDESIKYGGAETEYFFRLRAHGYRYLLADLTVYHHPHLTLFSLMKKAYLQGKTHRRLLRKNVFPEGDWLMVSKSTQIESFYYFIFHQNWLRPLKAFFTKWRAFFKKNHHDLWFYLSNRDVF